MVSELQTSRRRAPSCRNRQQRDATAGLPTTCRVVILESIFIASKPPDMASQSNGIMQEDMIAVQEGGAPSFGCRCALSLRVVVDGS